ncbi:carbohydrate ABC transporter permease [Paenibacillus roseipurpureus]|uniref:Carbohydrate ABC transporter permease n=1 Tax=Paenibacillus roseopurpureus TaxID=2918901 RepID=A0AA96LLR8_9BACL|nr:carbohydrate ABC transporter permease [Paenibacillus sp. MBLB1832]WNR42941.1 carbohydrate ABC transporter permease [Paenibacillus sp. MBLB1832]
MNKRTLGEKIFDSCNILFLLLLSFSTVYPLIHVAFASFSDGNMLMTHFGFLFHPLNPTLDGYIAVFKNKFVLTGYRNTLFIIVVGVALNLFMTAISAYALTREGMMLKKPILLFIIFTMYFSGGLIPGYLNIKSLGLIDNLFVLIIPAAMSAFNFLILKTFFESIPSSLEESARIDGANELVVLFRIIIPLSLPAMAVIALYYGVAHWNSYFSAMLYIRTKSLYPLQLVLRELLLTSESNAMATGDTGAANNLYETLKYALIMVATVPILVVYPFLQRYFVKGALIGAVKG